MAFFYYLYFKGEGRGCRESQGEEESGWLEDVVGRQSTQRHCPAPDGAGPALLIPLFLPRLFASGVDLRDGYLLMEGVGWVHFSMDKPGRVGRGQGNQAGNWTARRARMGLGGGARREKNQFMQIHFLLDGGFSPKETLNFVVLAAAEI